MIKYSLMPSLSGGRFSYTEEVLTSLKPDIRRPTAEAEVLLVSLNDITQLSRLKAIRGRNPDKLIVVGGSLSFVGETLLAYSDIVNVGEGFEFFKEINEQKFASTKKFLNSMEEKPYILTKIKINEIIKPSRLILWDRIPCVQQSKTNYYYLLSKGCPNHCRMCYTSWTQPFQRNTSSNLEKTLVYFTKHRKLHLTLVSNEGFQFKALEANIASKSVMVKQFIENPDEYKRSQMLHIGVEGFGEKAREWIGKPISNEDLQKTIFWTKNLNIPTEWFLILGIPGDNREEFISMITREIEFNPKIWLMIHWLSYPAHTPLWREPIDNSVEEFDRDEFFFKLNSKNRRFRTRPIKQSSYALWRSFIIRIPYTRVDECIDLQKVETRGKMIREIEKLGLSEYLHPGNSTKLSNECIKCPRDK